MGIGLYEILLFLHVVGAIVWIGLGMTGHAVAVWADRSGEHRFAATFQRAIEWIEAPASLAGPLLLLGTGIGLVLEGPWRFSDAWILAGLTGYAAALALGAGVQMPVGRRLTELVQERGPDDAEAISLFRRLNAFMWVELAILVVVLFAMTTKPTGAGPAEFWAVVGAVLAASIWLASRDFRAAAVHWSQVPQAAPRA